MKTVDSPALPANNLFQLSIKLILESTLKIIAF